MNSTQQPVRPQAGSGQEENYKDKDGDDLGLAESVSRQTDDDWDDEPPSPGAGTVTATLFVPVKADEGEAPPEAAGLSQGAAGQSAATQVSEQAPAPVFVPVNPSAVGMSPAGGAGLMSSGPAGGAGEQPSASADASLVHPAIPAGAVASATAAAVVASSTRPAEGAAGSGASANLTAGAETKPVDGKPGEANVARTRRQSEGAPAPVVPDFCNAGVAMRTAVIAHLGLIAVLCTQSQSWASGGIGGWSYLFTAFEGSLLINMACLCLMRKFLNGQPQKIQWVLGAAIPAVLTMLFSALVLLPAKGAWLERQGAVADGAVYTAWSVVAHGVAAGMFAVAFFIYFRLRARAMAPSFSEARLQALQARIRPHFLFNSLNTVLGLIRTDPKRAESTLENLADLFRVFMRDARELVPLEDEVITCKEYLAIEKLRLAPRLAVTWNIDDMPGDALLPSLLLQPLLENAVHHGIEPRTDEGVLNISIRLVGERVRVEVDNPISTTVASRPGNQMALSNVRERLMLLYDTEAELRTGPQGDRYHVLLEFPYRKERRRRDVRRHFNPDR
ncbi:MAG: histidine kinase [Lautropia sp.]|nr:histidine kinase [Lautropia sp.]